MLPVDLLPREQIRTLGLGQLRSADPRGRRMGECPVARPADRVEVAGPTAPPGVADAGRRGPLRFLGGRRPRLPGEALRADTRPPPGGNRTGQRSHRNTGIRKSGLEPSAPKGSLASGLSRRSDGRLADQSSEQLQSHQSGDRRGQSRQCGANGRQRNRTDRLCLTGRSPTPLNPKDGPVGLDDRGGHQLDDRKGFSCNCRRA